MAERECEDGGAGTDTCYAGDAGTTDDRKHASCETATGGFGISAAACSCGTIDSWPFRRASRDSDFDAPCAIDDDTDGVVAVACGGLDCDDHDARVRPDTTETCDGIDDDCDGRTDEGGDALCSPRSHAEMECTGEGCAVASCDTDYADCDGDPSNGCEIDTTTSADHCGACEHACILDCSAGACDDPIQVAPGGGHTCILRASGRVACRGSNEFGQLGRGTIDTGPSHELQSVNGVDHAVDLQSGDYHTCVRLIDDHVWCWGGNYGGSLGDGTFETSATPVEVAGLDDVTQLSVGLFHSCALRRSGGAVCWGWNEEGQLGDGTRTNSPFIVPVVGSSDFVQIQAGGVQTCALVSTGDVVCWGDGLHGGIGDGEGVDRPFPTAVAGLHGVSSLHVGDINACALAGDHRVHCWGANEEGRLGDGTGVDRWTPVLIGPEHVRELAQGGASGCQCALLEDGTAWCWGLNRYGCTGSGTDDYPIAAAPVSGLTDIARIAVGGYHAFAQLSTGELWAWGLDGSGELGSGLRDSVQVSPVRVVIGRR